MTSIEKLKKIVEILPILVGFLIFCGFLKLYLLYNFWEIRIIDYLDLSEILLSFLNDLNIFLFILFVSGVYISFTLTLFHYAEKQITATPLNMTSNTIPLADITASNVEIPPVNPAEKSESLSEILDNIYEKNKIGSVLIMFTISAVFAIIFFWTYNRIWLFLFSLMSFQFILISLEYYSRMTDFIKLGLSFSITFIAFTFCIAAYDVNEIKEEAKSTINVINMKTDTITTNENYYLIGKTQNYIFLYDRNENRTEIIKMENVNSIQVIRQKK